MIRLFEDKVKRDAAETTTTKVVADAENVNVGGLVTSKNVLVKKVNDEARRSKRPHHDIGEKDLISLDESQEHPGSARSGHHSPMDADVEENWDVQNLGNALNQAKSFSTCIFLT